MSTHRSVDYRKKALPRAFVRRVLRRQQQAIFDRFMELCAPGPEIRVLDVGVNASLEQREQYFFEASYPYPGRVVAAGLEDGDQFRRLFPGIPYVQVRRDRGLPFEDREFDLVFCSAVIEHVGDRNAQSAFIRDLMRVGRRAFLTTPNRWYPVELHTMLPFVHYLPPRLYRRIYRFLGFDFFSREENLNLLDEREMRRLLEPDWRVRIDRHRFLGLPSNLLVTIGG